MTKLRPNPRFKPTVLAFGGALPSTRCARFGAAELARWAAHSTVAADSAYLRWHFD